MTTPYGGNLGDVASTVTRGVGEGLFLDPYSRGDEYEADQIGLEFESAEALDQTVSRLEADGFRFTQKPMDQSWLWRDAILNDPDGHQLLFYFAGKNRLHPPWRVGND